MTIGIEKTLCTAHTSMYRNQKILHLAVLSRYIYLILGLLRVVVLMCISTVFVYKTLFLL